MNMEDFEKISKLSAFYKQKLHKLLAVKIIVDSQSIAGYLVFKTDRNTNKNKNPS